MFWDQMLAFLAVLYMNNNDTRVPRNQPGYVLLHRIRPVLDHLNLKFLNV